MKRRVFLVVLAVLMIVSLTACGKKGIEGKWKFVSGDMDQMSSFGVGFTIAFSNGKVTFEPDFSGSSLTAEQKQLIQSMLQLYSATYEVKSDTELIITIEGEKETVPYKIVGDTLTLGEATFKRQ